MLLPLPGERPSRLWGAVLATAAVVGLCALGCATTPPPLLRRRAPPSASASTAPVSRPGAGHQVVARGDEGARFVERSLRRSGLRFGIDGSTRSLWEYLRVSHREVTAATARPGDVVFFDRQGTGEPGSCEDAVDHAGIVESVAPEGRITFVEARGGQVLTSFVDPAHPLLRRDARGEIANTFLRAKTVDDPVGARYFAGEMLCGVLRPEHR